MHRPRHDASLHQSHRMFVATVAAAGWRDKGGPDGPLATVTAEKTGAGCQITIIRNNYTDAVTPSCCAPPGIEGSTCAGPWGITNNHVGEPWPPR